MSDVRRSAPPGAQSGTQALDRAALLVETVVRADEPMTFLELVERCELPRSTTSRMLAALERTGLLERTPEGAYVGGRLFWLYATRHDPWEELVRLARPVMERLGEATLETVHLSVARRGRAVQVAQVDSQYMLGSRDWSQVTVPEHASALGKVLFAHGALEVPATLARLTPATLADPAALRRDLVESRGRGWAVALDELEEGLAAVAAPITGDGGQVVAALGISGPTQRLRDRLDEVGRILVDHAGQLSSLLRRDQRDERNEGVA